jgi:hypothetical protein
MRRDGGSKFECGEPIEKTRGRSVRPGRIQSVRRAVIGVRTSSCVNWLESIASISLVVCLALAVSGCERNARDANPESPSGPPHCPGTVVGNPSGRPEIRIVGLQPGASMVTGTARNVDARAVHVVLWARTDQWYVQPFINRPLTDICSDGSWSNTTHPWTRFAALLVDSSYDPGSIRQLHPSAEKGVLAWDEYPSLLPDRVIDFSGYRWNVKQADRAGPGPNDFSDSESNVRVDDEGLHLRIDQRAGRWYCAEVFSQQSLGYGSYTYQVSSRVDAFDVQTVFSGFVYESLTREIDIEFSKTLARPGNAQFVVQPFSRPGNVFRFTIGAVQPTSHRFVWRPDRIEFVSWRGLEPDPNPATTLSAWTYRGPDIPPPGAGMRFNAWLFDGRPPAGGRGDEVVVRSFRHEN